VHTLAKQLAHLLDEVKSRNDLTEVTNQVTRVLDVAGSLQIDLDLWHAQNALLDAWSAIVADQKKASAVRGAFIALADRIQLHRDLLGGER